MTVPTPLALRRPSIARAMLPVGGALVVAGSLLAWAKVSAVLSGTKTFAGTVGGGRITVALGVLIVVGGLASRHPRRRRAALIVSTVSVVLTLAVAILNIVDISTFSNRALGSASYLADVAVGEGLYVVLLGAALAGLGISLARSTGDADPTAAHVVT